MNRLFLALPVTLFNYQSIQDDFKDALTGRWVPAQNLHLTLQFFADLYEPDYLIERLSSLDLHAEPSKLKGLSLFANEQILCAKTKNSSVHRIHAQIQEAFGLHDQQEFIPHITLIRIKKLLHPHLFEQQTKLYQNKTLGTVASSMQLIQSHLTSTGAQYEIVKEFQV